MENQSASWRAYWRAIAVGRPRLAFQIAEEEAQRAEEQEELRQAGQWLTALASALYHQGQIQPSARILEKAVNIQPDAEERARSLIMLATRKVFFLGSTASLLEFGRAQEISDAYPSNLALRGNLLSHRALLLEQIGDFERSLDDSKVAFRLLLQAHSQHAAATSLNNAGLCLADRGRTKSAIRLLAKALALVDDDPHSLAEACIKDSLGYVHLLTDEYSSAEQLLKDSYRRFRSHHYRFELIGSLVNLSLLYERTNRWDSAKAYAQKAVKLAESLGLEPFIARAKHQLESVIANTPRTSNKPVVFHGIVHTSPVMRQVVERIRTLASVNESVLVLGPTGTGKELVAKAIHFESKRGESPFIPFNCASTSRDLLESRLFGHRRGAFTGADREGVGVIRAAEGGTLFLDEIGELSLQAQGLLLRFLQSGEIQPLGIETPIMTNVRVIAATNRDLMAEAEAGRFRMDLYYRLNVASINLPPLWRRREDIRLLANHFAKFYSESYFGTAKSIPDVEVEEMVDYDWPGNVRELEHFVKRRVLFDQPEKLSRSVDTERLTTTSLESSDPAEIVWRMLDESEKYRLLIEALSETRGNVTKAAQQLGISRRTIQRAKRGKKIPPS